MNTLPEKIKLPEIHNIHNLVVSEQASPVSPEKTEKSAWTKSYRKKHLFLAKKVADEELFGDALQTSAQLGLNQINEDETAEDFELDEEENENKKEVLNVFRRDALISSKYKEHGKGPAFGQNGQVIKHSIVGSAEMFERHQRGIKKNQVKESGAGVSFDKDNQSASEMSFSRSFRPAPSLDRSPSSYDRIGTQSSLINKQRSVTERKKEPKKELAVSKEEILKRVSSLRDNQNKFYETESKKYLHLPLGDQLHHTKEKRCLDKFEKRVVHWKDTIEGLNSTIKRNAGKPVMLRSDEYREKIEMAEAFSLVRTDDERFGSAYWYITLRKYGEDFEAGSQRVFQDIPEGFNCPQIVKPGSTLEIIRKPVKLDQTGSFLPSLSETRYLERTRDEYINDKSAGLQTELDKVMTARTSDLGEFMVEGRSKLESEVDAFFKMNRNKDSYIVPKAFFGKHDIKNEDEVIQSHYDFKEIKKNGLAAYVK